MELIVAIKESPHNQAHCLHILTDALQQLLQGLELVGCHRFRVNPDLYYVAVTEGKLDIQQRVLLQTLNSKDNVHGVAERNVLY